MTSESRALAMLVDGDNARPSLLEHEAEEKSKVARNRDDVRILSHILVCGVRYTHAIVIGAALHLYWELTRSGSPWRPQGEVSRPVLCFVSPDVFSPEQDWLSFDGGLAISLGGTEQHVSHRVRAPGR